MSATRDSSTVVTFPVSTTAPTVVPARVSARDGDLVDVAQPRDAAAASPAELAEARAALARSRPRRHGDAAALRDACALLDAAVFDLWAAAPPRREDAAGACEDAAAAIAAVDDVAARAARRAAAALRGA